MIVVLSGEGPTDLGRPGMGEEFLAGPMTVLLDFLIETLPRGLLPALGYSLLQTVPHCYVLVDKAELEARLQQKKREKRPMVLAGKKHGQETAYFHLNAWMLAEIALEHEGQLHDRALGVLFRDSDGTHSTPACDWQRKWDSMLSGFTRAGFERGVPMLPKPKSEAWLLCAAKESPYENCGRLEELSGNDASPNTIKKLLAERLSDTSSEGLNEWLRSQVEVGRLDMPSFNAFKARLVDVLQGLTDD